MATEGRQHTLGSLDEVPSGGHNMDDNLLNGSSISGLQDDPLGENDSGIHVKI